MKDEDIPQHELDTARSNLAASVTDFLDIHDVPIRIGTPVRYAKDARDRVEFSVWNPTRWGIAVGFGRSTYLGETTHTVKVASPYVVLGAGDTWGRSDEWYTDPRSLVVLS